MLSKLSLHCYRTTPFYKKLSSFQPHRQRKMKRQQFHTSPWSVTGTTVRPWSWLEPIFCYFLTPRA